ncbi:MAG: phosphatase PAP2 family protein [Nanoarchaeota archaeon]|nr:phosphatase PAP2 family protein [Nanoarchaeota archaeon]MBU4124366.1 phosphatase PAP2 family protein [Nanoarchaeota archaeon]
MDTKRKIGLFLVFYAIIGAMALLFWNDVNTFDIQALGYITSFQTHFLDNIFTSITFAGSILFWVLMIVLFWASGNKKLSTYLFIGIILEELLTGAMKYGAMRPRPLNPVLEQFTPAFPSAHSARATLGAILIKNYRFVFVPLMILVLISRLYLGVHYPSDILFGVMNGILIALVIKIIPEKKIEYYLTKFDKKLHMI